LENPSEQIVIPLLIDRRMKNAPLPASVMKICFPPVANDKARLLILGSLPGAISLTQQQYYAHPRNQFWPLMEQLTGSPLTRLDYPDRLDNLQRHGIALWDVVARAERRSSLDQELRNVEPNALSGLIARLPRLEMIAFNGQKAASIGRRQLPAGQPHLVLPSSSPAFTMAFAAKLAQWEQLRPYLA
jgi:hypoxanthine-DNA glycosylase